MVPALSSPLPPVRRQPRRPALVLVPQLDDKRIPLQIALAILRREGRDLGEFYGAAPSAVMFGDASVDRDALARFLGIARA